MIPDLDILTPTQRRILAMLNDGLPHSRREIHGCLVDELGALANIRVHICHLRKMLRPMGHEIICEYAGRTLHYRRVKLLPVAARRWKIPSVKQAGCAEV